MKFKQINYFDEYNNIFSFVNLYKSYKHAIGMRKNQNDIIKYKSSSLVKLCKLREDLINEKYEISKYNYFTIYDPKVREIAAPKLIDRIMQNTLCDNYLYDFIIKRIIYSSGACQKGKGTKFSRDLFKKYIVNQIKDNIRLNDENSKNVYVLKMDIKKYFENIDQDILIEEIRKIVKNERIFELLVKIIRSYEKEPNKGLPLGNQTSQLFALYYLNKIDRLIKEKYRMKYYIRYMDDMIVICNDKKKLKEVKEAVDDKLKELKLELNNKTQITNLYSNSVSFIGHVYKLTPTGKIVTKVTSTCKNRFKKKLKYFIKNNMKLDNKYYEEAIRGKHKFYINTHDYAILDNNKNKLKNIKFMYNHQFYKHLNKKYGYIPEYEYDYSYIYQVINSCTSHIMSSTQGYNLLKSIFSSNMQCINVSWLLYIIRKKKRGKKNELKPYKKEKCVINNINNIKDYNEKFYGRTKIHNKHKKEMIKMKGK